MIEKKWFPSQAPAAIIKNTDKALQSTVAYYKQIKDTPIHGGRVVAKIIGRSKKEAETIAAHICDVHNKSLSNVPANDAAEKV